MRCTRQQFEQLVAAAIEEIPERFRAALRNVVIAVERAPTAEQLEECDIPDGETMYGYYEGTALIERGVDGEPILPDRILLFQEPLEEDCETIAELRAEIATTLRHEIAHHFGTDDDRLEEIGKY
ncbi:MAG: metallopeptidase family protein [bacterium]|nr:metallopeptidase family protein [bacterium]